MPSTYQPRRPRASPLWQLVRHGWDEFLASYESKYRQSLGPLHPAATATVESFLREAKLISPGKLADLLSWKHSGFHIHDGGEKPVAAHDSAGRKRLAEYLLRHPFSLQKITWNASTQTVIYRSKRHYNTKRNFEIFKAPDFIAAALLHLPPKGQQTVRYYGTYSNKNRGQTPLIPDRIIRPPVSSNQQSKINKSAEGL